jgi:hypothetical protein
MKDVRQITETRMPLILIGKHDRVEVDRPINSQVRIILNNAGIVTRAVIGGHLVNDFGFVFKRTKAV